MEWGRCNSVPSSLEILSSSTSLVAIATPVGALLTGPVMDKLGRKRGCQICSFTMIASWAFISISKSVTMLCFSRLLCGISTGLSTVTMVYVSEISHPRVRAALLCLNSVFFSLGILLTCIAGSWLTWKITAICSFFLLWFLPESPHWLTLVSKGDENCTYWEKTESSLRWLYRNELIALQEIECMKKKLNDVKEMKSLSLSESLKCLRQKSVIKPFFLLIGLFILQQFSGAYVLIFYAVDLFKIVGGKSTKLGASIDALKALILMGAIRFVMSCIVSSVSQKLGRRPLLMTSYIGMSIASLVLGICLYSSKTESNLFSDNIDEGHLLPVVCLLLFVCFSALGVLVIPWTLPVELLPVQMRGVGGGIMVSWGYLLMFITVKLFPDILYLIGISNMFFFLSFACLLGFIYIFLLLPETLGKSFSEIEETFK
ncbi:Glucose transporter type 1 [Gryllus bimaculatus]|nr:Glucose transporter type 1 [Gryllus bimaculatus]